MSELQDRLAALRIEREPRRRKRGLWIVLVLVLLVAVAAGIALRPRANGTVEVRTVKPRLLTAADAAAAQPILTASGYLVPRRKAVVSSKIQGRLAELRVEEGSRVAAGEVIARLESVDYQAQVARARAATLRGEAAVLRAEADLAEYRRQLRKAADLAAKAVGSQDDKEAAESRVKLSEASLAQAKADVAVSRADLAVSEASLDNTLIRAPFAGTVVKKMAEVGESVAPIPPGVNISSASGAIVALADLDTLEAEIDVGEANVAALGPDQPAEASVEAFPDRRFKAVLRQIIPSADRTKATVLVKVTLLDKDKDLKPEMSAKIDFLDRPQAASGKRALTVPATAIAVREAKTVVFVANGGKAHAMAVETGASRRGATVVQAGLSGSEDVIDAPPETLKNGDAVRVR